MSFRLIQIDATLRREHFHLRDDDECYCLGEYAPRAGFGAGPVNNLIANLKKPVSKRCLPEYRHKEEAIRQAAQLVRSAFQRSQLAQCTFVPIPPSKMPGDPLFDDRLTRVLQTGTPELDVREVLTLRQSMRAHHEHADHERRPGPEALRSLLAVDAAALASPLRPTLVLFDDVLTAGTHFRACKDCLLPHAPQARIVGLFLGRRRWQPAADGVSSDRVPRRT